MKREKAESANNIWNKEGFLMCGLRQMEYVPVSAEPDPGYAAGSAE